MTPNGFTLESGNAVYCYISATIIFAVQEPHFILRVILSCFRQKPS